METVKHTKHFLISQLTRIGHEYGNLVIQWNLSIAGTIGTSKKVRYREVSAT